MAKSADISTKRLISLAPENWVKWVTQIPDIVAGEVLNSEFQWISRESEQRVAGVPPRCSDCEPVGRCINPRHQSAIWRISRT